MRAFSIVSALLAFLVTDAFAATPSKLMLTNEFGEKHQNVVGGNGVPLPGSANVILMNGATAPVDGTTGLNVAAKGSLYIAQDTGALYQNTGTKVSPAWSNVGASTLTATLSGLSISAGAISSSDTILQAFNKLGALPNGTFTPTSETVSAAGAISTTKMESVLANGTGSDYAATLAAPSSQDGQIKILKMSTATHAITLACTNIAFSGAYTPTGTTTLTFSISGQTAVFMAIGSKWVYLGGSAVAS
jgi:hypothetical protein